LGIDLSSEAIEKIDNQRRLLNLRERII